MNLPPIAIINFSELDDADVREAIRAVNRQVTEDFMPVWGKAYQCGLHTPTFEPEAPEAICAERVAAAAVIFLLDNRHVPDVLAYHALNTATLPAGFVFADLGNWTVTLSHEVLELIVDPTVSAFVPGPDPRIDSTDGAWLWHAYEVCDPVERAEYLIDGISVSNFVLPAYFGSAVESAISNDFLGVGVRPFDLLPGCHLGIVEPDTREWVEVFDYRPDPETVATESLSYMRRCAPAS